MRRTKQFGLITLMAILSFGVTGVAQAGYVGAVLGDNPIAYYRFEDASMGGGDSIADSSTHSFTGTVSGAVSIATGAPIGVENQSVSLSGGAGYVNIGKLGNLFSDAVGNGGVTVTMWVKTSVNNTVMSVFGNTSADYAHGSSFQFTLNRDSNKNPATGGVYVVSTGAGTSDNRLMVIGGENSDTGTTDGTWHYLAIVHDPIAGVIKCYTAQEGDTQTTEWTTAVTRDDGPTTFQNMVIDMIIGGQGLTTGTPGLPYTGLIDEVAVFGSSLSKSQLDAHITAAIPEPATMLLLTGGFMAVVLRRKRS